MFDGEEEPVEYRTAKCPSYRRAVTEVVVDGRAVDAGGLRDVADVDGVDSALGDELAGDAKNLGRFDSLTCTGSASGPSGLRAIGSHRHIMAEAERRGWTVFTYREIVGT